jgi:hypothetical protein
MPVGMGRGECEAAGCFDPVYKRSADGKRLCKAHHPEAE